MTAAYWFACGLAVGVFSQPPTTPAYAHRELKTRRAALHCVKGREFGCDYLRRACRDVVRDGGLIR